MLKILENHLVFARLSEQGLSFMQIINDSSTGRIDFNFDLHHALGRMLILTDII